MELALKLLDEDEIRGYKLHVEVAKFQLKGEYDASKKKKKCKDYKKKLSMQQKFVLFFLFEIFHINTLEYFGNSYLVMSTDCFKGISLDHLEPSVVYTMR